MLCKKNKKILRHRLLAPLCELLFTAIANIRGMMMRHAPLLRPPPVSFMEAVNKKY